MNVEENIMHEILSNIITDRDLIDYMAKNRGVDDFVISRIIKLFGERGVIALKNFGKGNSRLYVFKVHQDAPDVLEVYTFLGKNGEYVIFPLAGYCGCLSKYPLNIVRRYPCYHLISFSLDLVTGAIKKYVMDFDDYRSFSYDFLFESLDKG